MLGHGHQCRNAATPIFVLVRFIPHFPILNPIANVSRNRPNKIVPVLHLGGRITGSRVVVALSLRIGRGPSWCGTKGVNYVHPMLLGSVEPSVESRPVEIAGRRVE